VRLQLLGDECSDRVEANMTRIVTALPRVKRDARLLGAELPALAAALEAGVAALAASTPLRGLVYAVGSIPLKPLKGTSAKDFSDAWGLNFLSAALAVKAAAPALAASSGSVVLFSTVACAQGFPNHAAIASAKGALEAFTRSAAAELSPQGVRVNCIAPSLSATPLAARMTSSEAMRKALGEAHPLGRLGTAADSAAMAEWLLDEKWGGWVTGQVYAVDGGRSTLRPKN
jgi:NAD(P)-dependent dehydrogenase (short-subunit alcohol dehydrogenase family)